MMPSCELSPEQRQRGELYVVAVAAVLVLICSLFVAVTVGLQTLILQHGDNPSYLQITNGILGGQPLPPAKHFWGISYVTAAIVAVTHVAPGTAFYLLSVGSCLAATWMVTRLWGPWVGLAFTVGNWTWIEFSTYGGAESLFALLIFLAMMQARSRRYLLAVLFAALATTVRPIGVFLVFVVLVAAWRKRGLRSALLCGAAAAAIALLYIAPLVRAYHDPLANVHGYQQQDWGGGLPVSLPLKAIVTNYLNGRNVGNTFIKNAKAVFVLLHVAALLGLAMSSQLRRRLTEQPVIGAFVLLYSAFILTYNAPWWALSIYPRLMIPVLPFLLWLYEKWLPRNWVVWTAVACVTMVLACGAGLGFGRAWLLLQGRTP
jgi:hypothetical protein